MTTPLLSIAIPTFNRAEILNEALTCLMSQIKDFKNIEVIISDNNSTDNTKEIINNWHTKYPDIITTFFQKENTGFYGNFKKCKELAKGKYVWLLSDDDHLLECSIKRIVSILERNNPDVLYLENRGKNTEPIKLSFNELVTQKNYRLTLISSSIFKSDLSDDALIFDKFKGSSFIGFLLLLSMYSIAKEANTLNCKIFNERRGKPGGYNFYDVFIFY